MSFFVTYGEESRFIIRVLVILVICLSIVVALLGFLSVKQRILYINPTAIVGTARVGYVPDEYISFFAMTFLYYLGNTNPYSALSQYKTAYQMMAPELQSAVKKTLENEIEEIGKSQISIQTTPLSDKIVKYDGDSYTVEINVVRVSWVYGKEADKKQQVYTVKCRKSKTNKKNPFGLEVVSYDFKTVNSDNIAVSN